MEIFSKIEKRLATREDKIINITAAVLLIALGFFGGYWFSSTKSEASIVFQSQKESQKVLSDQELDKLLIIPTPTATTEITKPETAAEKNAGTVAGQSSTGKFAASANGTKYYSQSDGCKSGINRIKPANLIWFETESEAKSAGYGPAACMSK